MTPKEMCDTCTHKGYCMAAYAKDHWCGNHADRERKKMSAREICQDCEKIFIGGPNAFLCPECRKKRIREGQKRRRENESKHRTQKAD